MKKLSGIRISAVCSVALGAIVANAAAAQTVVERVPSVAQSSSADPTVGDIIVTARRESEVAQSVPVTISAFTGDVLRQATIVSATDLMTLTPGISTQGTGSSLNTFYSIRGITRQITGNGQPGVISYFSEVPVPNAASNLPFFDIANVQVLKGPQGTLFGRNTVGGAVLIYPETPTHNFEGYLNGKVQNFDGYAIEGAVNIPVIADKISVRIAGLYDKQDGYTRNLGAAGPAWLGGRKERAVRASVLIEPFDGLRNTTIFDYDRLEAAPPSIILSGPTAAGMPQLLGIGAQINPANPAFIVTTLNNEVATRIASGPRVTNTGGHRVHEEAKRWGITNRTELDVTDNWSLINIFAFRSVDYVSFVNLDGSSLPLVDSTRGFKYDQYSDELQIHGSFLDDKIKLIAGAFYLKSEPAAGNVNSTTIFFQPNPQYTWQTDTSKAVFANVSVKLDNWVEGLRFTAGYRHTWDKQSICSAAAVQGAGAIPGVATAPYNVLGADDCKSATPGITNVSTIAASSNAPGWTVGLDWQASRSLFLYAVTRRGYRSGGVNNPALGLGLAAFQAFKPETNTDVEVGLKSDWRVGGMVGRFNISGFYSWQKDVQIAFTGISQPRTACVGGVAPLWIDGDCNVANNPASGALTINAGDTKVKGLEAELVLKPIPEITLSVQGTLLDPSISKAVIPGAPVGAVIAPTGAFPFAQILNQNIAKRSLSASASFDLPLPDTAGKMTFGVNYYVTSDTPLNALVVPGYDKTNARLDWKNVMGGPVDVGLFAQNIFNQKYVVAPSFSPVAFAPFLVSGIYNEPRMYGIEARIRW
jgi:iron complex outermembrane receptor protein